MPRGPALRSLAVRLVEVLPGPPTRAGGYGPPASARAERGVWVRRSLPVVVGWRVALRGLAAAGCRRGAELGAGVLDGVVGEVRASGLADGLAGAGSLDGALRHSGAARCLLDGQLADHVAARVGLARGRGNRCGSHRGRRRRPPVRRSGFPLPRWRSGGIGVTCRPAVGARPSACRKACRRVRATWLRGGRGSQRASARGTVKARIWRA